MSDPDIKHGYWGCDVDSGAVELARKRFEQQRLTGQVSLADHGEVDT